MTFLYSLCDSGCVLPVSAMAKLMGHDLSKMIVPCSESQVKKMLGMSVHRGTMGLGLMTLLASLTDE